MNQLIQSKNLAMFIVSAVALVCFGLAPIVQAVGPDTEGAIAGANNGEGIGALVNRTTGVWNTGTGFEALNHLTAGNQNTATGFRALFSDTNGGFNTATGVFSLFSNASGFHNTATGAYSLANNGGHRNTANGVNALRFNTRGASNTAVGTNALFANKESFNTAIGESALLRNVDGFVNTATGASALGSNIDGDQNTAIGFEALVSNTAGNDNTAVGSLALANSTGTGNTALGARAGLGVTFANNVIVIGTGGSNVTGSCFIGNIRGHTTAVADAIPVVIDSAHQLGTMSSSRRFKKEINPMDKASEAILALKPVTFHYKNDKTDTPQFGLVAEQVAEVNPDLVVHDENGEIYTVRYDAVNAMLLNEFLKEHRKVEQLTKDFESKLAEQQKQIDAITAGLQKVSAQLEVNKSAPQLVNNNQ
jgi:trimeric autotransporter adhesin